MKRLLIAGFLIITSVIILAVTSKPFKKQGDHRDTCCVKKCSTNQNSQKTDYLFWEPMGRLMMVPQ